MHACLVISLSIQYCFDIKIYLKKKKQRKLFKSDAAMKNRLENIQLYAMSSMCMRCAYVNVCGIVSMSVSLALFIYIHYIFYVFAWWWKWCTWPMEENSWHLESLLLLPLYMYIYSNNVCIFDIVWAVFSCVSTLASLFLIVCACVWQKQNKRA